MSRALGERLRRERNRRGERQIDTAARFNVAQATYARWETGDHRPSIEYLAGLADFLGESVDDIYTLVFDAPAPTSLDEVRRELAATQRDVTDLRGQVKDMADQIRLLIEQTARRRR